MPKTFQLTPADAFNSALDSMESRSYKVAENILLECVSTKRGSEDVYIASCANLLGYMYGGNVLGNRDDVKARDYFLMAFKLDNSNPNYADNIARSYLFEKNYIIKLCHTLSIVQIVY